LHLENACDATVRNNTFSGNGAGTDIQNSLGSISFVNNIIVHSADFGIRLEGSAQIGYNDVWNSGGADYVNCSGGVGAISADPLFIGGEPFDFHLSPESPGIDAGDPESEPDPDGTVADLGAFPVQQSGIPSKIRRVYLVQFTHLDIGFTDPQDVVADQYKTIIDRAISYADNIPSFKWAIESVWQLDQWLKRSTPAEIAHLKELVDQGKIALCAGYATMHTATLETEELHRFLYPARRHRQRFGFDIRTIYQDDVPGYAWALPSVLADAGVRYFATGVNDAFGGTARLPAAHNPFYWEGPDGGRVLTWISYGSYIEWYSTFQMYNAPKFFAALALELKKAENAGYPYDAIMIMCGNIENTEPGTLFTSMAAYWNRTYANPKLILSNPQDFFDYVESKYPGQFETYRGDWSGAWDIISLNAPQSMSMNRQAHAGATTAEKLSSINAILTGAEYDTAPFESIYANMLQFDEHSGGGAPWPGMMTETETQRQSEIAFNYAKDAYDTTSLLIAAGLETLANQVHAEQPSILVFNPLSWTQTDVVRTTLDASWRAHTIQLIDAASGASLPLQWLPDGNEIVFIAGNVPAIGYKTFRLQVTDEPATGTVSGQATESGATVSQASTEPSIENEYYRISVSPQDGSITHFYDKVQQRELVNSGSGLSFNGCIRADEAQASGGRSVTVPLGAAIIDSSVNGPVACALRISRSGSPMVRTEIWLYSGIPRAEIINTLDRTLLDWVPQALNYEYYAYAFPFDLPGFSAYLEGASTFWNPAADHLPGSPLGHFAIQCGGCLSDGTYRIQWAQREAFVAEFESFHGLESAFAPAEATLISRILKKEDEGKFNDGSVGPIVAEPGADPLMVHAYAFCGAAGDFEATSAFHFNRAFSQPLLSRAIPAQTGAVLPDSGLSFFTLDQPNVMLIDLKLAESGGGFIARLLETEGLSTPVRLASELFHVDGAQLTNGVEEPLETLSVVGGAIQLRLEPHQIRSAELFLSNTGATGERPAAPFRFELYPNYPNPFNPITIITFSLSAESPVKLEMFNILGQRIATLLDEPKPAGVHRIIWNGQDADGSLVSTGVYVIRITAGSMIRQRKLVLIK